MKRLILFFCLMSLSACLSSEKSAYDSLLEDEKSFSESKKNSQREITYLKNISRFEENNFQFVIKQMKKVIKNYSRMKRQLIEIEAKLDRLLNQLTVPEATPLTEEDIVEKEELSEEAENTAETDPTPLLMEEEITDDTDIFPEETEPNRHIKPQKKTLKKLKVNEEDKNEDSLMEAKNLFKQKSYESAISQFQKYRDENPKGEHYPEATYYIGQSFKNLKMPIEAKVFFNEIVQSHPQSLWASRAKENLKE